MSRVLFHIGDAPCHGRRFHSGAGDTYPDGDPRGLDITNLLQDLVDNSVEYYFAEINDSTAKMIEEFNKVLATIQGRDIKVMKLANAGDLLESVATSITSTILNSQSVSIHAGGGNKPLKTYAIDRSPIDWSQTNDNFEHVQVELQETSFESALTNLKHATVTFRKRRVDVLLARKPFAKGGLRYAYAALVNMGTTERPDWVKSVLKESIFAGAEYNTEKYYKQLVEVQVVAKYLASEFVVAAKGEKSLRFLNVCLAQEKKTGVYYTVEDYMEGVFIKWMNNAGIVNEEDYACTLNAFSHWTYEATNHYLLVTDLQGFKLDADSSYLLTDPAITCLDDWDRFSSTNLGKKGLKKFFQTHQCNSICQKLKLERHRYQTLPNRIMDTVKK